MNSIHHAHRYRYGRATRKSEKDFRFLVLVFYQYEVSVPNFAPVIG